MEGKDTQLTPDFYLVKENRWVEVKNPYNVKNEVFNKKLEAFRNQYPSEKIDVVTGNRSWIPS